MLKLLLLLLYHFPLSGFLRNLLRYASVIYSKHETIINVIFFLVRFIKVKSEIYMCIVLQYTLSSH